MAEMIGGVRTEAQVCLTDSSPFLIQVLAGIQVDSDEEEDALGSLLLAARKSRGTGAAAGGDGGDDDGIDDVSDAELAEFLRVGALDWAGGARAGLRSAALCGNAAARGSVQPGF